MSPENPTGGGGGTPKTSGAASLSSDTNVAVEALRRQLEESLYPTLAAAVGVGFVLAGSGSSELGKGLLRLAGTGVAGQTLRMIAATLAKIDPDKARAALELEGRLNEPMNMQAAMSELSSLRPRRRAGHEAAERHAGRQPASARRDLGAGTGETHGGNGGSRPGGTGGLPRR